MAANIFAESIRNAGWPSKNGLVVEIALEVRGQFARRSIAARTIALDSFQGDPVQIAAQCAGEFVRERAALLRYGAAGVFVLMELDAGARRIILTDMANYFVKGLLAPPCGVERQLANQESVENDAEGIDVSAAVQVRDTGSLFRTHVAGCPDQRAAVAGKSEGLFESRSWGNRFGDAEVDDAGNRLAIDFSDENVGRLQVTMDDGLLMCVLNAFANLDEERESVANRKFLRIAVFVDGGAVDVLHDEVGLALRSCASVKDFSDRGMVHHGKGLLFGLKSLQGRVVI